MRQRLSERWKSLSQRERMGLKVAFLLLMTAWAWRVLLQPAWQIWQGHESEWAMLEQQRQQMASLQSQAHALQKLTPLSREEALRTLQALTRNALPSAQVSAQNERVSISFKVASPAVLASWLQNIRDNAQARVIEAQWQRSPEGLWEGTMVLQLPSRNGQP